MSKLFIFPKNNGISKGFGLIIVSKSPLNSDICSNLFLSNSWVLKPVICILWHMFVCLCFPAILFPRFTDLIHLVTWKLAPADVYKVEVAPVKVGTGSQPFYHVVAPVPEPSQFWRRQKLPRTVINSLTHDWFEFSHHCSWVVMSHSSSFYRLVQNTSHPGFLMVLGRLLSYIWFGL